MGEIPGRNIRNIEGGCLETLEENALLKIQEKSQKTLDKNTRRMSAEILQKFRKLLENAPREPIPEGYMDQFWKDLRNESSEVALAECLKKPQQRPREKNPAEVLR